MGKSTISTGPFLIANCKRLPEGKSPESHQPILTVLTTEPPAEQCTWHSNPLPHRSKRHAALLQAAWHRRWTPNHPEFHEISWEKNWRKNRVNLAEKNVLAFGPTKKKGLIPWLLAILKKYHPLDRWNWEIFLSHWLSSRTNVVKTVSRLPSPRKSSPCL